MELSILSQSGPQAGVTDLFCHDPDYVSLTAWLRDKNDVFSNGIESYGFNSHTFINGHQGVESLKILLRFGSNKIHSY